MKKKHYKAPSSRKPVIRSTVTGRIANTKPEPQYMLYSPVGHGITRTAPKPDIVAMDLSDIERRVMAYYGGRRTGKTEAMRVVSGDWSGVPVEPLDAGLKRILSRG